MAFQDALKRAKYEFGAVLVALHGKRVVGSVSLRKFVLAGKRIGLVDALVVEEDFRERGIGKSLVDAALSWFKEKECKIVYATVDRNNFASWNAFINNGFSISEFRAQLRDLGLAFIRLWIGEFNNKPNLSINL